MTSIYGNVKVPTSGTPVALASVYTPAYNILIKANKNNTGTVYIKGATKSVGSSPKGIPLNATEGNSVLIPFSDLATIFLDVDTNNDSADFFANTNP